MKVLVTSADTRAALPEPLRWLVVRSWLATSPLNCASKVRIKMLFGNILGNMDRTYIPRYWSVLFVVVQSLVFLVSGVSWSICTKLLLHQFYLTVLSEWSESNKTNANEVLHEASYEAPLSRKTRLKIVISKSLLQEMDTQGSYEWSTLWTRE